MNQSAEVLKYIYLKYSTKTDTSVQENRHNCSRKPTLEFMKTAIIQYFSTSTRSVFVTEEYDISENGTSCMETVIIYQ